MIDPVTRERLFSFDQLLAHPLTRGLVLAMVAAIVLAVIAIFLLRKLGRLGDKSYRELMQRCLTWAVLLPLLGGAVLLGAATTILLATLLGLACYVEFCRALPKPTPKLIHATVCFGIVLVNLIVLDNWYGFFVALMPFGCAAIAIVAIWPDQPKGYVERVALGVWAYMLFGVALAHLGLLAGTSEYRPRLLLVLVCVEVNDVFAYLCGKAFGRRKLAPNTSPNKTLGGALGAVVCTTILFSVLGRLAFEPPVGDWAYLVVLGALISVLGQLGDLVVSSIKRDVEIKDMGSLLPGHGGLLDRFDSLLLVLPAVFHYFHYFQDVGLDLPQKIFTGSS